MAIWLAETCHERGSELVAWNASGEAALALPDGQLRPDAWFTLSLGDLLPGKKLTALVEVDRGTERGLTRWQEKVEGYRTLFLTAGLLEQRVGQQRARVLVTVPDVARRDRLAAQIAELSQNPMLTSLFYLIVARALTPSAWREPLWRNAGSDALSALIPPAKETSP